jgi:hypothetical protein
VHPESVATPPPTTPYVSVPSSAAVGTPIAGVDFTLSKADDAAPIEQTEDVSKADQQAGGIEGVAAADYDPSKDRMDDEARRAAKHLGEDVNMRDVVEEVEDEEEEDEIDDIFALVDEDEPKPKKKKKVKVVKVRLLSSLAMTWFHNCYRELSCPLQTLPLMPQLMKKAIIRSCWENRSTVASIRFLPILAKACSQMLYVPESWTGAARTKAKKSLSKSSARKRVCKKPV